ncbi:glycosyltransferase family 2 protein [Flavobacteriaceae bacterium 14752]|uniref:glycosyltransferase family 2 protein n=1 Tax=Mesohalobacter salilacus TaxID=2491711 RepID=UPI000F641624|nr:glycosyltransferase [Flavobacteriaceae bacterium 14752]
MKLSLIICTYKRAEPLLRLLDSVKVQSYLPDEILIIDGSPDDQTSEVVQNFALENLKYHQVKPQQRGLTKQRNIGIELCDKTIDIVAFLDDDIILYPNYFKNLIATYTSHDDAIAVGGYIVNEVKWKKVDSNYKVKTSEFIYDNFVREDGARFILRKKLGLAPNRPPAYLPKFSHGRSVGHLPPSGKIYPVEQFMGGVSSYKKEVFKKLQFSSYFEGYGLYEDADFCFRLHKLGQLYVNTAAQCEHHHHPSGRPNQFQYGQMVVRNGWYVWRLRWPKPGFKNQLKWHANVLLLTFLRFLNIFTAANKKQAFTESCGRFWAWLKLWFVKPKIQR